MLWLCSKGMCRNAFGEWKFVYKITVENCFNKFFPCAQLSLYLCVFFLVFSCRTKQNLSELPLSAHLLAPIQRICRYPLHLSELVKHSPSKQDLMRMHDDDDDDDVDHSVDLDIDALDSKETFELALSAMKRVTEMVNEGNFRFLTCNRTHFFAML